MNFFTWDKAISLYPLATFEQQISLLCVPPKPRIQKVLEKSCARDFQFIQHASTPQLLSKSSIYPFLGSSSRHIGDSFCWVLKLNTTNLMIPEKPYKTYKVFGNAWNINACGSEGPFPIYRMA